MRLIPDVIHVGLRKTGTTYLRRRLLPLFGDGVLCVGRMAQLDSLSDTEMRPIILSNPGLLTRPKPLLDSGPECIDEVASLNPNAHIIISIRSQFTIMRSTYGLAVKNGYANRYSVFIDEAIESGLFDYSRLVNLYRNRFGRRNVTILLFEQMIADPNFAVRQIAATRIFLYHRSSRVRGQNE
jgi:hypothetical protein